MTRMARRPSLVQVLLLVLAAVVPALEARDSSASEIVQVQQVAIAAPAITADYQVRAAPSDPADSERHAAHCPYACLRAPAVRPRVDHLWAVALLLAGLLLGAACSAPRNSRVPLPGHRAAATGTVLLLRLCVCRR
ncbi:hypothetical protein [Nocardia sp. NPDC024068]|uniref:hypothetical protein n=1 Tax=Nocardia sp. NPDC024068 TaxID=3157197 RepID=UPI0033C56922